MTDITNTQAFNPARAAILAELDDRGLLNGIGDDLYDEIADALIAAVTPAIEAASIEKAVGEFWAVEEYKIWKGINPSKPTWASVGFCCSTYEAAKELAEYEQRAFPDRIRRVVKMVNPDRRALNTPAAPDTKEPSNG